MIQKYSFNVTMPWGLTFINSGDNNTRSSVLYCSEVQRQSSNDIVQYCNFHAFSRGENILNVCSGQNMRDWQIRKINIFQFKEQNTEKKESSVRIHSIQFLIEFIRQYVQVKLLTLCTFPVFFHQVWHPAPALLGWYFWTLADEIQQPFHTPYWQVQLVLPLTVCQLNRHISSLYVLVESASLLIFVKHWNGRVLPRTHPCGADLSVQRNQEQATLDCVGFLFWSSMVYPASSVFYSPHLPAGNQYIFFSSSSDTPCCNWLASWFWWYLLTSSVFLLHYHRHQ